MFWINHLTSHVWGAWMDGSHFRNLHESQGLIHIAIVYLATIFIASESTQPCTFQQWSPFVITLSGTESLFYTEVVKRVSRNLFISFTLYLLYICNCRSYTVLVGRLHQNTSVLGRNKGSRKFQSHRRS